MLVLSSPSGAGKSSISRRLLAEEPALTLSVSSTTRPMRPGEVEGHDYYFVSQERFRKMVSEGEMLEYATVFDNSYGTPKKPVEESLERGIDVLFDIDWQGTRQVAARAPQDMVTVFILPPSIAELERRLFARAQDSEEVVRKRMAKAFDEMSRWVEYDYVIINEDLDQSVRDIQAILCAERLKRAHREECLHDFVCAMRSDSHG